MSAWKDSTSYAQGERKGETTPRQWSIQQGQIRITIYRHIHYPPDVWLMCCRALHIDDHGLESKNKVKAQEEAILYVNRTLGHLQVDMNTLRREAGV